jgi:hypothetical protein
LLALQWLCSEPERKGTPKLHFLNSIPTYLSKKSSYIESENSVGFAAKFSTEWLPPVYVSRTNERSAASRNYGDWCSRNCGNCSQSASRNHGDGPHSCGCSYGWYDVFSAVCAEKFALHGNTNVPALKHRCIARAKSCNLGGLTFAMYIDPPTGCLCNGSRYSSQNLPLWD